MNQKTIGYITFTTDGFYFGQILDNVYKITRQQGNRLIVIRNDEWGKYQNWVAADHIDGWIITAHGASEQYIKKLLKTKKPIVSVGVPFDGCHSVLIDNREGMFKAVEHLIQHGHRSIAYITRTDCQDMFERFEGYKDALIQYDIPFDPELVVIQNNYSPSSGREAAEILFSRGISFTAVAACVDYMAASLYEYISESGFSIPEDIAVIGFDNDYQAALLQPPLSTVNQPVSQLASGAIELLNRHMQSPGHSPEAAYVKTNLVLRGSCGCEYLNNDEIAAMNQSLTIERDLLQEMNSISYSLCEHLSQNNATSSLSWLESTPMKQGCLGVFTDDKCKYLNISQLYHIEDAKDGALETITTVNHFPGKYILSKLMEENELLVISSVHTATSKLGVLCCAGSLWDLRVSDSLFHFTPWLATALEKEKLAKKLETLAYFDTLCGIPNRKLFLKTLSESLETAGNQNWQLAVLLLDLDNFKKVNDFFGHSAGDELLIQTALLMSEIAGDTGMAARLGGDEFVILLPKVESIDEVIHTAERIIDTINLPFSREDLTFHVTASVGISLYPQSGSTSSTLLKKADIAMYKAKERGKCSFYY